MRIEKLKRLTKAGKRLLPALAGLLKHDLQSSEEMKIGQLGGIA